LRLLRTLPYSPRSGDQEPGGARWFPREFQGEGRHDNPSLYGCLYVSEVPVSAVAEALAMFRGSGAVRESMLTRFGLRLALIELRLPDSATLLDLDDPLVLSAERLRPSQVASHRRTLTREHAAELFHAHPGIAGLRWWSSLESTWINATLFDRAARYLRVQSIEPLTLDHPAVREAADFLGLLPASPR
jgi:RES domain